MSSNINLPPWREKKRAQQRQNFITWLVAAGLLGIIISISIPWMIGSQLKQQTKENEKLHQQELALSTKAEKLENIDKPAKIVQKQLVYFQSVLKSRYAMVGIFNILSHAVPSSVKMLSIERDGSTLLLKGDTNSTQDISKLLSNLNQSNLLTAAKLKEIKTTDNRSNLFTITATINFNSTQVKQDANKTK